MSNYISVAALIISISAMAVSLVGGDNGDQPEVGGVTRFQHSNIQANLQNTSDDFQIGSQTNDQLLFGDSANHRVGISTTSPSTLFHVDGGANATTTPQFGSGPSASSNTCFNMTDDSGNEVSAYISGTSWVIETGTCN